MKFRKWPKEARQYLVGMIISFSFLGFCFVYAGCGGGGSDVNSSVDVTVCERQHCDDHICPPADPRPDDWECPPCEDDEHGHGHDGDDD